MKKEFIELIKDNKPYFLEKRAPEIKLGKSRIGGPIIDYPKNIKFINNFNFMAQLNCKDISKYNNIKFFPKKGFLYFFVDSTLENGKVFYFEGTENNLVRIVKEHDGVYFEGFLISGFKNGIDSLEDRYYLEDNLKVWNDFYGEDIIKIGGIHSNCQKTEEEIIKEEKKFEQFLLLHIGSGDGVQNVFINIKDLQNMDFSKCKFEWGQS